MAWPQDWPRDVIGTAMHDPNPKPAVPNELPPKQPDEIPSEGGDVDYLGETPAETPPAK